MTVTFNTTFLDDKNVSSWSNGINFNIKSNYVSLLNFQCCAYSFQNYTLERGTTTTPYLFIFYLPGTKIAPYTQNSNTFTISINQYLTQQNNNQYIFNLSINPNFPSYTGELTISLNSSLQLNIQPSFLEASGHLGVVYSNNLTHNSNIYNNLVNTLLILSTFAFLGVLAIFINDENKKFNK